MPDDLAALFERKSIEDIVLSPRGLAFFESGAWSGPRPAPATEAKSLQAMARHIAEQAGTTLGLTQPSVDAFLHIGGGTYRAHVVIPPLILEGPEITLRRLPERDRFSIEDFRPTEAQRKLLTEAVRAGRPMLIAGATGSGKTSLLTSLLKGVPESERVLILEDSPEIPLPNALSSKLLARPDRFGFRNGATWDLAHLVFESLRMRPDRLVLGECRGPEARAIETALMTGHAGIMTTLHAGSAAQAIERFNQLARQGEGESARASHDTTLWDLVVHVRCEEGGQRRISEIWER